MPNLHVPARLHRLTEKMISSYSEGTVDSDHLCDSPLPKQPKVASIVSELKDLLFPGYWRVDETPLHFDPIETGTRFNNLYSALRKQIAFALRASSCLSGTVIEDAENQAADTAVEFLERLPAVRELLVKDATAAFNGDPACQTIDEAVLCYPGIQAITIHRMAHELYQMKVPFIPRMMAEQAHVETGIDIHPGATIGDYFFIDHGTGVVIGETTSIGSHVKIYQGVTLGALSFPTNADGSLIRDVKRHPNIEDNVIIYANATVLGGSTTIGHDSVIGSNVWITSTVQPHTTVVMEKPKLRMRNDMEDELISSLNYQI